MDAFMPTFVREERLSAKEYLKLMQDNPQRVQSTRFVLPEYGKKGDFGHFVVQYYLPQKRMRRLPSFMDTASRYS